MTMCVDIGKFYTTVQHRFPFGMTTIEVEIDIKWISCGYYSLQAKRLDEPVEGENKFIQPKTEFNINLAPEWIQKVMELYPLAEREPRSKCYKPFYEDYHTDRGMMDFGQDVLFQSFKHPLEERVILTNNYFNHGVPGSKVSVFNIEFEEFRILKELLDNPNGNGPEIFYSGCQFA